MGNRCPCLGLQDTGAAPDDEKAPLVGCEVLESDKCFELPRGDAPFQKVGLGTRLSASGKCGAAVKYAIASGYRHIDCASNCLNEKEIGDVLTEIFEKGNVERSDLFITGKLNNPYHRKEHVRPHLEKTLKDLNIDYLDLWLMHWPVAFVYVPYDPDKRGFDEDYDPDGCSNIDLSANDGSKIDKSVKFEETWAAMEECYQDGLVLNIGVCNINSLAVDDLLTYARVKPAVIQNEMHPYCQLNEMVEYLKASGIVPEAYSPLGGGRFKKDGELSVLADDKLIEIGERHGKSAAQVALRWNVQRGCVVIPKSVNHERLKQNIDIEDFELSEAEMLEIKELDRNHHFQRPNDLYQESHWSTSAD